MLCNVGQTAPMEVRFEADPVAQSFVPCQVFLQLHHDAVASGTPF